MSELSLTTAENLLYTTVKLTMIKEDNIIGSGTGFFYNVLIDDNLISTILVTNRHVVEGCDNIIAQFHIAESPEHLFPSGEFGAVQIEIDLKFVALHPDPNVDLCGIPISRLMAEPWNDGRKTFFTAVTADVIPADSDWANFDAIEEVLMIGCPNGIFDEANNLPIARRGITATPLSKRYNGQDEFLIDMACFPGSSGSPVFVYNRDGYLDRATNTMRVGQQRLSFVGILFAGPTMTNTGQIVFSRVPRIEIASMMHLGSVIRSSALRAIDDLVRDRVTEARRAAQ